MNSLRTRVGRTLLVAGLLYIGIWVMAGSFALGSGGRTVLSVLHTLIVDRNLDLFDEFFVQNASGSSTPPSDAPFPFLGGALLTGPAYALAHLLSTSCNPWPPDGLNPSCSVAVAATSAFVHLLALSLVVRLMVRGGTSIFVAVTAAGAYFLASPMLENAFVHPDPGQAFTLLLSTMLVCLWLIRADSLLLSSALVGLLALVHPAGLVWAILILPAVWTVYREESILRLCVMIALSVATVAIAFFPQALVWWIRGDLPLIWNQSIPVVSLERGPGLLCDLLRSYWSRLFVSHPAAGLGFLGLLIWSFAQRERVLGFLVVLLASSASALTGPCPLLPQDGASMVASSPLFVIGFITAFGSLHRRGFLLLPVALCGTFALVNVAGILSAQSGCGRVPGSIRQPGHDGIAPNHCGTQPGAASKRPHPRVTEPGVISERRLPLDRALAWCVNDPKTVMELALAPGDRRLPVRLWIPMTGRSLAVWISLGLAVIVLAELCLSRPSSIQLLLILLAVVFFGALLVVQAGLNPIPVSSAVWTAPGAILDQAEPTRTWYPPPGSNADRLDLLTHLDESMHPSIGDDVGRVIVRDIYGRAFEFVLFSGYDTAPSRPEPASDGPGRRGLSSLRAARYRLTGMLTSSFEFGISINKRCLLPRELIVESIHVRATRPRVRLHIDGLFLSRPRIEAPREEPRM